MDPLSITAATISLVTSCSKVINKLRGSHRGESLASILLRIENTQTLLKVICSLNFKEGTHRQEFSQSFLSQAYQHAYQEAYRGAEQGLRNIYNILAEINAYPLREISEDGRQYRQLSEATDKLEMSVDRLRYISQVGKMQLLETQLDEVGQMLRLLGSVSEEGLKDTLEKVKGVNESGPTWELHKRQHSLEEIQEKLHSTLGRVHSRPFACDPLCFPFIIPSRPPGTGGSVVAQLKLDTGAVDNWISSAILERAGIESERVDCSRPFVGAGGAHLNPFGQARIIWYSENQALTRESLFLVHDQLPFDVILGSDYILRSLSEFAEPVLPIRHVLTKSDYQELHTVQLKKRATNQQIISLQKAQDAKEREEKRLLKAVTRAATKAATPNMLGTSTQGSFFLPGTPRPFSKSSSVLTMTAMTKATSGVKKNSENHFSASTAQVDDESSTTSSSLTAHNEAQHV